MNGVGDFFASVREVLPVLKTRKRVSLCGSFRGSSDRHMYDLTRSNYPTGFSGLLTPFYPPSVLLVDVTWVK